MKFIDWLFRKLLKNLGKTPFGYRSGQPGLLRLFIMLLIMRPKSRINLAFADEKDPQDPREKRILEWFGITYYGFAWGAGGPKDWEEVEEVCDLIDSLPRPVWVGCEGGKDRTGGLVARWKQRNGYDYNSIFSDFGMHKYPAWPWIRYLFRKEII